jgi:hypothetical protein
METLTDLTAKFWEFFMEKVPSDSCCINEQNTIIANFSTNITASTTKFLFQVAYSKLLFISQFCSDYDRVNENESD